MIKQLKNLGKNMAGEIHFDPLWKLMYATDASAYREIPAAVTFPKNNEDIQLLIEFASKNKTSIIPRGGGTSLAGQVVGSGIVADVSKHLNKIIEINAEEKWVRVQPGVVLSELNLELKKLGLQFGPETSTANRCTMGGMLGNNSCGLHSLVHGSVRDHILEVSGFLSDSSKVTFKKLDQKAFDAKTKQNDLEGKIYKNIAALLSDKSVQKEIKKNFPNPSVKRRNNGYAIDQLLKMQPFSSKGKAFNFCELIAGSEGTLLFVSEMKLNLIPQPPKEKALVCVHLNSLEDAFKANLIGLKYNPSAIELMDKTILDLTKNSLGLRQNRFFLQGNPEAILIIELWSSSKTEIEQTASKLEQEMRENGFGYHFPVVWGDDIAKVWNLRKAGLGVLSNMPGDAKPVSVIEDTAVPVEVLPQYMADFKEMLQHFNLEAVYHAHIATGELHLRPILNLKDKNDVELFKAVAVATAKLVKKHNGSLSGEHGDGRLRGEFIPFMLGEKVYHWLKAVKKTWDPDNIFNPGKIIDTPNMNESLRYQPGLNPKDLKTYFDYKLSQGFIRAIEKCNGTGDCRKSELSGGIMCPSYMATREEIHSTRGRANVLRELITRPSATYWADQHLIFESLDLCLSCKACKSECPSGIDMAKFKAEFLQNYYDGNPVPLRSKLIAYFPDIMKMAAKISMLSNLFLSGKVTSSFAAKLIGFEAKRGLPMVSKRNVSKFNAKTKSTNEKLVYLFNDEFLQTTDAEIGIKALLLLEKLGYKVVIPKHVESGRTFLSKGFLKQAKKRIRRNISLLAPLISNEHPLVGIEPSAILSFRDEYIDLCGEDLKEEAKTLAENTMQFDEFIMREFQNGNIKSSSFTNAAKTIKLHGHCHQKALVTTRTSIEMLEIPENYTVEEIPSGCCGMAGSFGYEKEHYDVSMKIGELVLFPEVRKASHDIEIAAPGTSCRDQIKHGTGRTAKHPVEILFEALKLR